MAYLLGAINKDTNKYENIISVEKTNKYKCVGCGVDLILRKGEKNFQNFIHKISNGCEYFKNPTPEQLLLDAKLNLKTLIETNKVDIYGQCQICIRNKKLDLPEYDETKSVQIDLMFENELVDLVYLDSEQKIIFGFEIFNGHPVKQTWYQINILELVYTQRRDFATQKIELKYVQKDLCGKCQKMGLVIRKTIK